VKVLFDATSVPSARGGVGRYVEELLRELALAETELTVVCKSDDLVHFKMTLGPTVTCVPAPRLIRFRVFRFAWEQTGLALLARRIGASIIHSPHYTMPLLTKSRCVVTLHDATFFSDPAVHSAVKRMFFRAWTRIALRRAAVCITPSQATADGLREHVPRIRARIFVAHLGIDRDVFHPPTPDEIEQFATAMGIGQSRWVAFLGTLEPRKNVPALVGAMASIAARYGASAPILILAGAPGWDDRIADSINAVAGTLRVLTPGYLPLEQLRALLAGAAITAYPSLGEGFGLPVLEAMASGAVVLTTRRLALPEVGGDAVFYCEPDEDAIGAALETLFQDAELRGDLRERAVARASEFTWRQTALAHLQAYRSALEPATW
jgi:glycosyltransferase involved in cell wall biosynthesis